MHLFDEKFWIAVAFFILVILLFKILYRRVINSLDQRAKEIESQLEQAKQYRKEAEDIKASYVKKEKDAIKKAEKIVESAKKQAQDMLDEAKIKIEQDLKFQIELSEKQQEQNQKKLVADIKKDAVLSAFNIFKKLQDGSKEKNLENLNSRMIEDIIKNSEL